MINHLKRSPIIAVIIFNLLLTSCSEDKIGDKPETEYPVSVKVQTPSQHSAENIVVSGQIESQTTAIISTRVMGFISEIKVRPGDKVQKGQLLAAISNEDILAKRAQAQAMISEAEANLKDAQKDYERFEILYQQQSATTKEFETMTMRYTSARARVEAARQMKIESEAILAYTNLVAPFSGVITQKHVDAGSLANPGMPIVTLEKTGSDYVKAYVSENDLSKLKYGMDANITVKSTGKKVRGKVVEISPSSQFTGGQFQIKVIIAAAESSELSSGMYVNVSIPTTNTSGTPRLYVPASAIIHKDQLAGLYTIGNDHTAQLRWLKVGRQLDDDVEVLSGLSPGEKFITQSDGRLYSGMPVSVE